MVKYLRTWMPNKWKQLLSNEYHDFQGQLRFAGQPLMLYQKQ